MPSPGIKVTSFLPLEVAWKFTDSTPCLVQRITEKIKVSGQIKSKCKRGLLLIPTRPADIRFLRAKRSTREGIHDPTQQNGDAHEKNKRFDSVKNPLPKRVSAEDSKHHRDQKGKQDHGRKVMDHHWTTSDE